MMATRNSTESDRRHLLQSSRPASIFSVMTSDEDAEALPRKYAAADDRVIPSNNPSLLSLGPSAGPSVHAHQRSKSVPEIIRPYRGFPSEQEYLDALKEWADSKTYFESNYQLKGWYGTKTIDYYLSKPIAFPSKKDKVRRGREDGKKKLAENRLPGVAEEGIQQVSSREEVHEATQTPLERTSTRTKVKGLGRRVFSRRGTVA